MRHTILTIRAGLCRFPTTDAPPHILCGDPVLDDCTPYCEKHHFLCYAGYGKRTPDQLVDMIYNAEGTIVRVRHQGTNAAYVGNGKEHNTVPVDVLIGDDK